MGSRISAIEYFLPDLLRNNQDIEKICPDFHAAKIEKKLGIASRHIAGTHETALDMAEQACLKLFAYYDRAKIDYVLLCTQSPEYLLPTSACILQDRLGLRKDAGALDFNLGCSGFVYGLSLAKGLIAGKIASRVLLVTSETYTKFIAPQDKGNMSIFGDAAAATVIEADAEESIHAFSLGTDGSGYRNLIVANGGLRAPKDGGDGDFLYMDGPEIFNFTLESLPPLIEDVLARNNTTLEKVDYIVFHQANLYMLETLRKLMKIPAEKFHMDLHDTGNTVSSTIPLALKRAETSGKIKKGDTILLAGFGVGYSYAATIITL